LSPNPSNKLAVLPRLAILSFYLFGEDIGDEEEFVNMKGILRIGPDEGIFDGVEMRWIFEDLSR
jgi:hypothetical protein